MSGQKKTRQMDGSTNLSDSGSPSKVYVDAATLRREFQLAFADSGYKLIDLIESRDMEGEPRLEEVLVLRRPSYTAKAEPELLYARVPDVSPQRRSTSSRKWDGVKSFENHWSRAEPRGLKGTPRSQLKGHGWRVGWRVGEMLNAHSQCKS